MYSVTGGKILIVTRAGYLTILLSILINIAPLHCLAATVRKHFLEPGQRVELTPGSVLVAEENGPLVVFGKERDQTRRNFLYLDKRIEVWNGGTRACATLLGVKRNVARPQYVVQISTETTRPVLNKQDTSGPCDWSYNNPCSGRDSLNFSTVSKSPLLMVGSASQTTDLLIVTNYGVAAIKSDELRPRAIKFKKKTGEVLVCPWNEKLGDYDIPQSARGHGMINGPVEGNSSIKTRIGPASVILNKAYPGSRFTATLSIDGSEASFKGPIIVAYEVPDFYSASLGMPTYVEENQVNSPKTVTRYYKPDANFPASWELRLNPPIMEEFGLGPHGPAMGEAVIQCSLWKFGDKIYGNGGYSYSDCGLQKGGQIEGSITDNKMSLRMTGSLDMQLDGPAPSSTSGCKGIAIVSDKINSGRAFATATKTSANQSGNRRAFTLSPSNLQSTNKARDAFLSQIDLIPPNTEYWNAICALPGNYGSQSILQDTVRLVKSEQPPGINKYELWSRWGSLAHMQYCAWLESANSRGKNHPITLAHADIADKLYERILEARYSRSEHHLRNYIKILEANGRSGEARAVQEQIKKLPKD